MAELTKAQIEALRRFAHETAAHHKYIGVREDVAWRLRSSRHLEHVGCGMFRLTPLGHQVLVEAREKEAGRG